MFCVLGRLNGLAYEIVDVEHVLKRFRGAGICWSKAKFLAHVHGSSETLTDLELAVPDYGNGKGIPAVSMRVSGARCLNVRKTYIDIARIASCCAHSHDRARMEDFARRMIPQQHGQPLTFASLCAHRVRVERPRDQEQNARNRFTLHWAA